MSDDLNWECPKSTPSSNPLGLEYYLRNHSLESINQISIIFKIITIVMNVRVRKRSPTHVKSRDLTPTKWECRLAAPPCRAWGQQFLSGTRFLKCWNHPAVIPLGTFGLGLEPGASVW